MINRERATHMSLLVTLQEWGWPLPVTPPFASGSSSGACREAVEAGEGDGGRGRRMADGEW